MKHTTLFIIILFLGGALNAQTYINNMEQVSGTWAKKGSPYIVQGEAIVPKGKTLKIKPGVTVMFQAGEERDYSDSYFDVGFLRVEGTLIAQGKKNDLIHFTSTGNNGYWGCIYLFEGDNNVLEYCKLEHGHYIRNIITGDNATGVISFQNAGGTVKNCLIVNNNWTGINFKNGSSPVISNNTISNNNYPLEFNTGSSPMVSNCIIWDNENDFYINGESYPVFDHSLVPSMPDEAVNNGGNLVDYDPKFINVTSGDYRLQKSSPCKKAGKDGKDMGAAIE